MTMPLKGKHIAFLFTEGVEQAELMEPLRSVEAAGGDTTLLSIDGGVVQMFNAHERGDQIEAELSVAEADPDQFDGLVLPGGVANPDALRVHDHAVSFIRAFFEQGKPVGVICHAPWTLIEADVVRGRTLTSWPSLQTDLRNAGANWVDVSVHVDNGLVSSRDPADLPAFCEKLVQTFAQAGRASHEVA